MKSKRIISGIFLSLLAAWLFTVCKSAGPGGEKESPFLNLDDTVAYVGMATCRSCHANVYETFIHTGMGRSFNLATREKSAATFDSHTIVYDTVNDFYYHPFFSKDSLFVLEYRLENGDTVHRRLEKISYIVGSGQHTNSHILDLDGYVYQAPVTWYTQEKRWDLAPGFRQNNSRFGRLLTDECITCHNNYPTLVPGSLNKFAEMPRGIECERCHGPGGLHVREKLQGHLVDTSKMADYTIVNPRRLPRDLQMDLCQRCHLQGIAVTEEGKTFFDFKPGMKLNSVMNVFLPRFTNTHEKFIMASQADRLRMSECFKNSGELSCLTCHHPHRSVEVTPVSQYNNACRSCHTKNGKVNCPEIQANAKKLPDSLTTQNCVSCHMPRSGSVDIPHVRITDHRIAIHNPQPAVDSQKPGFLGLKILTKENPTPLDMARGYLATHDKYIASPVMLDSAWFYLEQSKEPFEKEFETLVHYYFLRENYAEILKIAARIKTGTSLDAWTAYRIGEACLKSGNSVSALAFFEQAAEKLPYHLDFQEKAGIALISLNRLPEAAKKLEWVLSVNRKRPIALCNLGYIHVLSGHLEKGEQYYDRALALEPDYVQALLNKAALLIFLKRSGEAKKLLKKVLKINPDNPQAREALLRTES